MTSLKPAFRSFLTAALPGLLVALLITHGRLCSAIEAAAAGAETSTAAETPAEARTLWKSLTAGENLAIGVPVTFSHLPDYALTAGENQASGTLTDGRISSRTDDTIWHNEEAVGWKTGADSGVILRLDLGSIKPISRVVTRVLGGAAWPRLIFPRSLTLYLSEDGEEFHRVHSITKVLPAEAELARQSPADYFYLPETGSAYAYPFAFDLNRRARYVALKIDGETSFLFLDEIAVLKGDEHAKDLTGLTPEILPLEGITVYPRHQKLVVSRNIATPVFLHVFDARPADQMPHPAEFIVDLPPGIFIRKVEAGKATLLEADGNRWLLQGIYDPRSRYATRRIARAVYFGVKDDASLQDSATAKFSWWVDHTGRNEVEVPVGVIDIPAVPPFKHFDVSLGWMNFEAIEHYPDFLKAFRTMGFNAVPTFPRDYHTADARTKVAAWINEARKEGMKVIYNESPFHVMRNRARKAGEIYHQSEKEESKHLCPSYTGSYYKQEMERVRKNAAFVRPDFVFFDIEIWKPEGHEQARDCSRCQAAFRESGFSSWDAFFFAQGDRMMKDLRKALAGLDPKPLVGLYNVHAAQPRYQGTYHFETLYPKSLDLSMPSLYVQGRGLKIQRTIAANHEKLKQRVILPWMTTGTYGEFDPRLVEPMIYEAALNGARGITYFSFPDFDPLDFYFHAKALKTLSKYDQLLGEGRPLAFTTKPGGITLSALSNNREVLLLASNYTISPVTARLSGEGVALKNLINVKSGEPLREPLNLRPGEHLLIHADLEKQP